MAQRLVLLVLAVGALMGADDLAARLAAPPRPHPRLILASEADERIRRACAEDPLLQQTWRLVQQQAEADLAAAPVQRELTGRRLLAVSRLCLARVIRLSLAWRLGGGDRFRDRAVREMLAAAAFSDWNPAHYLDVAEMTAALAIGYDWLHAGLDAPTRTRLRAAIVTLGLRTFTGNRSENNWNQVCNGGIALGALAVLEDEPELARRLVLQAVRDVPLAAACYEPDGAYPEGPSYWSYGTGYQALLISALESALGTDAGLATPAFLRSARYQIEMVGPTGRYFNYGDCGAQPSLDPTLAWFAGRGDVLAARAQRQRLTAFLATGSAKAERAMPLLLAWLPPGEPPEAPRGSDYVAHGRTPVATHRSGWDADATWVAVKGGSPSSSHAHMDVGSFVLDSHGLRWAEDPGKQEYHPLEAKGVRIWEKGQDAERWRVFRYGPFAHNVLIVDGALPSVAGHAAIISHATGRTVLDLGPLHAGQLTSARRGIALLPDRSVVIRDEFAAPAERTVTVRWAMLTRAEVVPDGPGRAILRQGGRAMLFRLQAPAAAAVETFSADPPHDYDEANPGLRLVGCAVRLPAGSAGVVQVQVAPPGTAEAAAMPLADW